MTDKFFTKTIEHFKSFPEVDAIILGGSRAGDFADSDSDYDVYAFVNGDISAKKRNSALRDTCYCADLDRRHWGGHWDDCVLKSGLPLEITYWNLAATRENLQNHLQKFIPWNGYTTCICHVVFNAKVLYDPKNLFADIKNEFDMPYPDELRENIIRTNREVLDGITPSYMFQLERAIRRGDIFKTSHVLTSFAAAYFDIIFALNRLYNPGEKKLIEICKRTCDILPVDFEKNLQRLFTARDEKILPVAKDIVKNLDAVISEKC
ncbi:MAG: DUF4037 domain-containing protein [Defluviitaleaceae bacterium]|nr:DUF4037 domain-containing protein [Defluviitaleaceae bacterium]